MHEGARAAGMHVLVDRAGEYAHAVGVEGYRQSATPTGPTPGELVDAAGSSSVPHAAQDAGPT